MMGFDFVQPSFEIVGSDFYSPMKVGELLEIRIVNKLLVI